MPITFEDRSPSPTFSDSFSSDTRSNYTFPNGTNMNGGGSARWSVTGGQLVPVQSDGLWGLMYPTSVSTADNWLAQAKMNLSASGAVYSGVAAKIIDGDNYCGAEFDTDTGVIKCWQMLAGTYSTGTTVGTVSRSTDYWLAALLVGRTLTGLLYDGDPLRSGKLLLTCIMTVDATLGSGHAGRPGLFSAGSQAGSNGTPFDDFAVWNVSSGIAFHV